MVKTIIAGLIVMAAALYAERAPDPRIPSGFGLVACVIEPSIPGPSFRMTIDDRADEMLVRTSLSVMSLPRDRELSTGYTHVAALTDGTRTIAVTLDRELRASVMTINDAVSTGAGQCERL
jgi:hypothetical protein